MPFVPNIAALAGSDEREALELNRMFLYGQIAAVDVLLNNGDRLPMCHRNVGNGGNILLLTGARVAAIDQTMWPLPPERRATYINRAMRYVGPKRHEGLDRVSSTLATCCGLKPDEEQLANFNRGFDSGLNLIANFDIDSFRVSLSNETVAQSNDNVVTDSDLQLAVEHMLDVQKAICDYLESSND